MRIFCELLKLSFVRLLVRESAMFVSGFWKLHLIFYDICVKSSMVLLFNISTVDHVPVGYLLYWSVG